MTIAPQINDIENCPCPTPIGIMVNRVNGRVVEKRCDTWACEHCGKVKKTRIAKRVNDGFRIEYINGNRVRCICLTQRLGTQRYIMHTWARLRALLEARGYHHLKFFWVKEFTENGERHLHVLVNVYIPWKVLKECWSIASDQESYIVWITGKETEGIEGDIHNAAGYAMKYLMKAIGPETKFEKGERRFGFSRHIIFKFVPAILGDFWELIMDPTPWKVLIEYHPRDYDKWPVKSPPGGET